MHDINTIKAMNAEILTVGDYVRVRDDAEVAKYVGETGRILFDDQSGHLNFLVRFDGTDLVDAYFGEHELEKTEAKTANEDQMRSAHEAALDVLDAHAIKPFWQRSGYQIRELLVEAILTERGLTKPE